MPYYKAKLNNKTNLDNKNKQDPELKCKWCKKQFKRKSPKVKHETNQLCIPITNRTICSICDITFTSIKELKQHLTSKEHIKKIIGDTDDNVEIVREQQITSIDIDPYLTKQDIIKYSKNDGKNITLKLTTDNDNNDTNPLSVNNETNLAFMNTDTNKLKLHLDEETELEAEIREEKEEQEYLDEISQRNNLAAKGYSSYQELIQNEIYNRPMPNEAQEEILCQLVDLNDELSDDKRTAFLQILKNLDETDADFMTTYIRDCNGLNMESKQIYLELIDKFIRKLTQIFNQGYRQISGKDILTFISRLSK